MIINSNKINKIKNILEKRKNKFNMIDPKYKINLEKVDLNNKNLNKKNKKVIKTRTPSKNITNMNTYFNS